jgi:hypothetical protein
MEGFVVDRRRFCRDDARQCRRRTIGEYRLKLNKAAAEDAGTCC